MHYSVMKNFVHLRKPLLQNCGLLGLEDGIAEGMADWLVFAEEHLDNPVLRVVILLIERVIFSVNLVFYAHFVFFFYTQLFHVVLTAPFESLKMLHFYHFPERIGQLLHLSIVLYFRVIAI